MEPRFTLAKHLYQVWQANVERPPAFFPWEKVPPHTQQKWLRAADDLIARYPELA